MRRAAALVVLLLAAACSGSGSTTPRASSSSGVTSSSQDATVTPSTTSTTAATTTTVALVPLPSPSAAAAAFVQAWRDGDQAAAATVALPAAVFSAFAAGVPSSVQSRGCMAGGFDPTSCVYRTDLGEAQVRATQQGDGWIIDQVVVSAA